MSTSGGSGGGAGGGDGDSFGEDPSPLYIMDLRPYKNVIGNQLAKGGGHESSHYAPAKILFCGIHNIHAMMDSMLKLQDVARHQNEDIVEGLRDDADSWSDSDDGGSSGGRPGHLIARVGKDERKINAGKRGGVEESRWLQHIRSILAASLEVVSLVAEHRASVLIHCSDGWDRTPQVTSLAQIILDPHARTLEGLASVVEKEWVSLGHNFSTRCSGLKLATPFGQTNLACQDFDTELGGVDKRIHHGICGEPHPSQQSPTFVQWLACVKQLLDQHPAAFEYRPAALWALAEAAVSGKYASFLTNCDYERYQLDGFLDFACPWAQLFGERREVIVNSDYDPEYCTGVLAGVDISMGKLDPWLLPQAGRQTHAEKLKQREVEVQQADLERSRREMESARQEVASQKAALDRERRELERMKHLQDLELAQLKATTASQREELQRLINKVKNLEDRYTEDVGHRPVEVREVHPGGRDALKCPILDKQEVVAEIRESEDPMQDEDDSIVLVLHMSEMQKNDAAARRAAGGSSPEVVGAPNLAQVFASAARNLLPPALTPKPKPPPPTTPEEVPKKGILVSGTSISDVDVHDNWFNRA